MAALRWDEQAQAYVESTNVPMRYDVESGAWVETTGMAYNPDVGAWEEKWNTGVKAYVYGAALETVTIKKDGIIVATVDTDSTGQSAEQITLSKGTYTLTGSVSGHTEEQTVDENTEKFRAMPEGALYWYGNECMEITGGWEVPVYEEPLYQRYMTKNQNYINGNSSGSYIYIGLQTKNSVDFNSFSKVNVVSKSTTTYKFCFAASSMYYATSAARRDVRDFRISLDSDKITTELTKLSGTYYAELYSSSSTKSLSINTNIYAIWLEK